MIQYYLLKHRKPVPCSQKEAVKFFADWGKRRIRSHWIPGKGWVSTIFLCFDHSISRSEAPVFFETMVFDENGDCAEMLRTSTHRDALRAHKALKATLIDQK